MIHRTSTSDLQQAAENWVRQGQIFPHLYKPQDGSCYQAGGMTKRELFAAMAMQGLLSHSPPKTPEQLAQVSVAASDALLKELEK